MKSLLIAGCAIYMYSIICECSNPQKNQVEYRKKGGNITTNEREAQKETLVFATSSQEYMIYYPRHEKINLVCDSIPTPVNGKGVIFVCGASFIGELLKEFKHSNIAGTNVSKGIKYRGYQC